MSKADERNDITVEEYIASIDNEQMKKDTLVLVDIMHGISGSDPQLYGFGTIGFGVYHYKYDSGREGDAHTLGFYPRKGKITVYLMDGTARYAELLAKLGKHTTTGYCIYVKQLSDVDLPILKQLLQKSYDNITSQEGNITKILWQT